MPTTTHVVTVCHYVAIECCLCSPGLQSSGESTYLSPEAVSWFAVLTLNCFYFILVVAYGSYVYFSVVQSWVWLGLSLLSTFVTL